MAMAKRTCAGRELGYYEELDTVEECVLDVEELVEDDSLYEVERVVEGRKRNVIFNWTI
jgi:hypothetical protein